MKRIIEPEELDHVDDASAHRNLRELIKINRFFGGHAITVNLLRSLGPPRRFRLLDVGAASGDHGLAIRYAFPGAEVYSADRLIRNLAVCPGPRLAADAFALPFASQSFDYVFSSLFLHHFDDRQVVYLLKEFYRVAAQAVIAVDLHRHAFARGFLPATQWLFNWDEITVSDGQRSVDAAWKKKELAALAEQAGLPKVRLRTHVPWFRLSLVSGDRAA
ncbi:MAG: methyltransferase domain-containing protein [Bryobacterales bacterium]|nr:methyltransferase domain-containing protein [Bryobacterales bacterium]